MPLFAIIALVGVLLLAAYLVITRKEVVPEREGIVKDILSKDALSVDFMDGRPTVVRLFGITPATDNEMLDDKIFAFFEESLRELPVRVKTQRVSAGEVVVGEVRTRAGEYVNALLVRQGFARWAPSEAAADAALMEAQELAKKEQMGVWNPAVRQLAEQRMRAASADALSDEDIANMSIDPEAEQRG